MDDRLRDEIEPIAGSDPLPLHEPASLPGAVPLVGARLRLSTSRGCRRPCHLEEQLSEQDGAACNGCRGHTLAEPANAGTRPNFSFLMIADAHDAVSAVPGVHRAEVTLADHHAAEEINAGVAAGAGFVGSFSGEATAELHELRAVFLTKAVTAGQDRVARPLVDAGATPSDLATMTLGEVPPSADLDRLRQRRALLGLPAGDDAPLLLHADGSTVVVDQVPLHLRRARLTRVGIETNGEYCRSLLASRYPSGSARARHG